MSRLYSRVFLQILNSSLSENWKARHVFEDILKLADRNGFLDMTHEALSRHTGIPLDVVKSAIVYLEAPDPKSRNKTLHGCRLVRIDEHRDWGWKIVNWEEYDKILNAAQFTESNRLRVQRYRANKERKESSLDSQRKEEDINPIPIPIAATCTCSTTENCLSAYKSLHDSLCRMYKRDVNDPFVYSEQSLLSAISRRPNCLKEIEELDAHKKRVGRYFPHSIASLLSSWTSALDAARNYIEEQPKDRKTSQINIDDAKQARRETNKILKEIGL